MAELAPLADDRIHAASLAAEMTEQERGALPAWLYELGRAHAVAAARVSDDECRWDAWLIEIDVGSSPITSVVGIDRELDLPVALAGAVAEHLHEVAMRPVGVGDSVEIEARPVPEVARRVVEALDRAEMLGLGAAVPCWPEPRALVRWTAMVASR